MYIVNINVDHADKVAGISQLRFVKGREYANRKENRTEL